LKFDRDNARVSLGLKQLGDDPWSDITNRYPIGQRLRGRVTNITDYGCFVEIEEGIEGLVHVSEMDWTNKNVNPNKVVHLGQEVEVVVLDIDGERRRISLGLKQFTQNPWEVFAGAHQKGDKISGKIKSITDFGIFIGLEGGIDGLIHLSDISWNETAAEEAIRKYQKGDELETVILAIDAERERISLGLKQLADDPVANYLNEHEKGSVVPGKVTEVDAKSATVELAENVYGILRAAEISTEKVEDARTKLNVGDEIDAKIIGTDRKTHTITLSIKSKDSQPKKPRTTATSTKKKDVPLKTTLGDLLKAKMVPEGGEG
jgi:small subunit ribosomal protein S1